MHDPQMTTSIISFAFPHQTEATFGGGLAETHGKLLHLSLPLGTHCQPLSTGCPQVWSLSPAHRYSSLGCTSSCKSLGYIRSRWQIPNLCQVKVSQALPAFIEAEMATPLTGLIRPASREAKCIFWSHGRDLKIVTRIRKCESVCVCWRTKIGSGSCPSHRTRVYSVLGNAHRGMRAYFVPTLSARQSILGGYLPVISSPQYNWKSQGSCLSIWNKIYFSEEKQLSLTIPHVK